VWAAGECLCKAGVPPGAPLTLARGDDGWLALSSGSFTVDTYVARVRRTTEPVVLAVLTGSGDASV
jgi:enediyne polyketide synthase